MKTIEERARLAAWQIFEEIGLSKHSVDRVSEIIAEKIIEQKAIDDEPKSKYNPDYWTRLEHQYAGMAMQGMVKRAYNAYCDDCANYENMIFEDAQALLKDHTEALADVCAEFAHALLEKMKEEKK